MVHPCVVSLMSEAARRRKQSLGTSSVVEQDSSLELDTGFGQALLAILRMSAVRTCTAAHVRLDSNSGQGLVVEGLACAAHHPRDVFDYLRPDLDLGLVAVRTTAEGSPVHSLAGDSRRVRILAA